MVKLKEGDYSINIYDSGDIVNIDEKSPNQLISGEMLIPYFKYTFSLKYSEITYKKLFKQYIELLKQVNFLKENDSFNENDILEYIERLFEIAQKDKRALNQVEIYLNYIKKTSSDLLNNLNFSNLLDNVINKINIAKRDSLFYVDDLKDKLKLAVDDKDINILNDIHYQLIERYVLLNKNDVIKECFFNLIYDGIYSQYPDELIKRAIAAINDSDYNLLSVLVNELYELDGRNSLLDK